MPLMGANDAARAAMTTIRETREAAGISMAGFGVQAQAQYDGGTVERWKKHHDNWQDIGATHLAIATHNAGHTNVQGHLGRIREYMAAIK